MERNRQWFTEPDGSTEHERHVEPDERVGHITSARPVHDQAAETRHQEREECDVAPLTGRDPHLSGDHHQDDDCDVRWIEEMLSVQFDQELARNRNDRGEERERDVIGAEKEAQRQA